MTREDVTAILDAIVRKFDGDFSPPVEHLSLHPGQLRPTPPDAADWQALEAKFGCTFPSSFKAFIEVMPAYNIPTVHPVSREHPRGDHDDSRIDQLYDHEMSFGDWDADLIPFLSVGNGDFFCLSRCGGAESPVFYVDHEDGSAPVVATSFDDWLTNLEYNLNGT